MKLPVRKENRATGIGPPCWVAMASNSAVSLTMKQVVRDRAIRSKVKRRGLCIGGYLWWSFTFVKQGQILCHDTKSGGKGKFLKNIFDFLKIFLIVF